MKYTQLKNEKEFFKLAIASAFNRFGDSIDALALTWLVYALSGNAMYSAVNFGINYLPTIILTPIMGAFIERRNKKRIMALSDIIRASLVILMMTLYMTEHLNVYIIMFITFMISTLETLRVPASTPLVASLVSKDKYDIAQSLHTSLSKGAEIIGMGLAGFLLSTSGIVFTFIVDVSAFVISGLLVSWLHFTQRNTSHKQSTLLLLKEGFKYTKTKPSLIQLCILACCINAFLVPINAFSSALSVEVYHGGPQMVSYLSIGFSAGSVIGSVIYPYIASYMNAKRMIQTLFGGASIFYIFAIVFSYFCDCILLFSITTCQIFRPFYTGNYVWNSCCVCEYVWTNNGSAKSTSNLFSTF